MDVRFNLLGRAKVKAALIGGWSLRLLVCLVCAVVLFFLMRITVGSFIRTAGRANHAIVLGLAFEDGMPTDDFLARLDAAQRYAADEPDATLILSGGNPDTSGKTEAAVMRELLLERGVSDERMALEDKTETTKENFRNTAKLVNPDEPIVLISSNYHMDRAVRTARGAGPTQILRWPARSTMALFGTNVMWEAILEINELTLRHRLFRGGDRAEAGGRCDRPQA